MRRAERCLAVLHRLAHHRHRWRAHYGFEIELERLLEILAADCQWMRPGRKVRAYEARCGVRFTDIDRAGLPPDVPPGVAVPILRIVRG